jgi:Raf kinase inhibitor-like YbhB/YbcL family protein
MMSSARMKRFGLFTVVAAVLGAFAVCATAQSSASNPGNFELHSKTFSNQGVLPLSTILNNQVNGVNTCTANGAAGGDQSPELTWTGAPWGTVSYVVVLYDVTASFTHWGMYNISGGADGLPANAGVAGSAYGQQILNDFALGNEYDGPCPPAGIAPDAHQYVFTVYALSTRLDLNTPANFPAGAETLYHGLIQAGQNGQILASASLTGFFSSTPPSTSASK